MKKALQDNWKFIITILIIAASGWLLYTAIIEIPQERIQAGILKTQQNAEQAKNAESEYELCISYAYGDYSENWTMNCKSRGEKSDCLLPTYISAPLLKGKEDNSNRCLGIYKTQMSRLK